MIFTVAAIVAVLAAWFVPPAQATISESSQLNALDGEHGNWFGFASAISGDSAVVGAIFEGDIAAVGAAYVFVDDGSTWSQQAKLVPPAGAHSDYFGWTVDIDGDTVAVGAPFRDGPTNTDEGEVYVFTRVGSTWTLQAVIPSPDPGRSERFGYSLALQGDLLAVAEVGDDDAATDAGAVHVFGRTGAAWTPQAKLTAGDGAAAQLFGTDVAMDGAIVVGAPAGGHNTGVTFPNVPGAAYVFQPDGLGGWSEEAKLTASDGAPRDFFGFGVDVSGESVIVGAYGDEPPGEPLEHAYGAAYVFDRSGSSWSESVKLASPGAANGFWYGAHVAIDGDGAVVAEHRANTSSGRAWAYERAGGAWSLVDELRGTDTDTADAFGESVDIDGGTVVVGATRNETGRTEHGSAYVFAGLLPVPVDNDAPAVAAEDLSADEGETVDTQLATFTDADAGDTHTATVDWGDGTTSAATVDEGAGTVSGSHTYADDGSYTVTVCVTDGQAEACDPSTATVANVAPAVSASSDATATDKAQEGETVTVTGAFSDPGVNDTHTATVDWGDGTTSGATVDQGAGTVEATHAYAGGGVHTVTVVVTDNADDAGTATATAVVNHPPIVEAGADQATAFGDEVVLDAAFTDAGPGDDQPWAAEVDWGDGTVEAFAMNAEGDIERPDGSSPSHAYLVFGDRTVTVTVTDADGATHSDSMTVAMADLRDRKQQVRDELAALMPTGDDKTDKRIERAIDDLDQSLAPELWVDGNHLDPEHGDKVLKEERQSVKDLEKVETVDTSGFVAELVKVDRTLAVIAMTGAGEAIDASSGTAEDLAKASEELARAREYLDEGDGEDAGGDPERAIYKYRKAWERAMKAMERAAKA